ncbi:homoprotocatechuate degradation operon regulator HpaR [Pantoea sp. LMR881]|uniref:homoprotocatechuate degradation operon regulator HpaR n=1 Tax=Pantoea sp. LMR881 TaxID=3014336 RepID=UPI0022AEA864|nr:homoprotocatechuate degradation operon regulator HpaR [Pantoea sp. LMR881]MCZ4060832.1 homoprotocatechuate degradation operon regulator HpaR [Pantoea sp. LMR881]MCZ4060929.1 homoprotocatechuate degradation operon regulator HpaR [Pantoea sp. LMR881]
MHDSLTIALLQARETAMGFFRPVLNRYALTEQQWRIIRILAEHRSLDFHALARQACILRPSLTGILTRLERDGLVFRLKPLNDQRKLFASLTPRGVEIFQQASREIDAGYQQIEAQFGELKMAQLKILLQEFNTLQGDASEREEQELTG